MPSTSSSAEPEAQGLSATEALASRYRHLFVLPRTAPLVALTVAATFLLSLVARGWAWEMPFAAAAATVVLGAAVVASALRAADEGTIADFRRTEAVLMASQVLWTALAGVGLAASAALGSGGPLAGAVLFGAFTCAGFEFLVISGAFAKDVALAAALAAIHPAATLAFLWLPMAPLGAVLALGAGAAALGVIAAFSLLLGRRRTTRGHSAVELFQAFMKTWTGGAAAELEGIISDHGEPADVTTKVMRFGWAGGGVYLVLPGVHPGPFYPVGSYNLPGVLSREFEGLGPVLTLHRPGGHERNLASGAQTTELASKIRAFAEGLGRAGPAEVRGPVLARVGKAQVSSSAFDGDLLLTISFAPLGSDDLEPRVEEELSSAASACGFDASVVDAHNSIASGQEHPDTADPGWGRLFAQMKGADPKPLRAAYAHSSEVGFEGGGDLTANGMGLLLLEAGGPKWALVLADSNNAAPGLRAEAAAALEGAGYGLVELCTSDSHDLAAKGLTASRGYHALGEDTPAASIAKAVADMARLADSRLAPCTYASGRLASSVRVFGAEALEEFASITQSSSAFAKRYFRAASVSLALLYLLALAA